MKFTRIYWIFSDKFNKSFNKCLTSSNSASLNKLLLLVLLNKDTTCLLKNFDKLRIKNLLYSVLLSNEYEYFHSPLQLCCNNSAQPFCPKVVFHHNI